MNHKQKAIEKKEWDRTAQSFWDCFIASVNGLKKEGYITLDEREEIINSLSDKIKEPEE